MTELLQKALEAVQNLPVETQDDIARAILHLAGSEEAPEPIDASHLQAVIEGLTQAKSTSFASDAEVDAAFRRFDP